MHRFHLRFFLLLGLTAGTFPLSGCLFRTRAVDRQLSDRPLKSATQQQLIEYVNAQAARVQSMQATVDIDSSAGDPKSGKVTDYKEIRGYVLARKPAMLRMKGLMPVVRNTAFDMVSDGEEFKLWIPPTNKFVIGPSEGSTNGGDNSSREKRMENMRPQYIYDALLMPEVDGDEAVLENGYEAVLDSKRHRVEQPNYSLLVIHKGAEGAYLERKIDFSRGDLLPYRQRIYDHQGNVATDIHYRDYKDYAGTNFPSAIEVERPREGYDITLNMVKLEVNKTLTDDQFTLEEPPGAVVVHIGQSSASGPKPAENQSQ